MFTLPLGIKLPWNQLDVALWTAILLSRRLSPPTSQSFAKITLLSVVPYLTTAFAPLSSDANPNSSVSAMVHSYISPLSLCMIFLSPGATIIVVSM